MAITPTEHQKLEWKRMGQAAIDRGLIDIGVRYMEAGHLPRGCRMETEYYDKLQAGFRAWLIDNIYSPAE